MSLGNQIIWADRINLCRSALDNSTSTDDFEMRTGRSTQDRLNLPEYTVDNKEFRQVKRNFENY